jgi:hypothetical protein
MARYVGRLAGHYTAGGHHDECGHWHPSGLRYNWTGLSILNEDEHHILPDNGVAYTACYDAIVAEVAKVNPTVVPVGPEMVATGKSAAPASLWPYFLNASNHVPARVPPLTSYHVGITCTMSTLNSSTTDAIFASWDALLQPGGVVAELEALRAQSRGQTQYVLNEFIPWVTDWCDCDGVEHLCNGTRWVCPHDRTASSNDGGDPNSQHRKGVAMNHRTWSWNAAAALFSYAFGTLAERKYKLVGQDQLIGGPYPDNEPGVTMLDWQTGEPNAKYHALKLLIDSGLGTSRAKTIVSASYDEAALYVLPYILDARGGRGVMLVNKRASPATIQLEGVSSGDLSTVEAMPGAEAPGFNPPVSRRIAVDGTFTLGPLAVAIVSNLGY